MKRALLLAVLINVIAPAAAAPKAQSPQECAVLADLALVARAAAKQEVPRATLDAMVADIYRVRTSDGAILAKLITDAAYSAVDVEPDAFSRDLRGGLYARRRRHGRAPGHGDLTWRSR